MVDIHKRKIKKACLSLEISGIICHSWEDACQFIAGSAQKTDGEYCNFNLFQVKRISGKVAYLTCHGMHIRSSYRESLKKFFFRITFIFTVCIHISLFTSYSKCMV